LERAKVELKRRFGREGDSDGDLDSAVVPAKAGTHTA
jgi:hypothetical protein